MKRLKPNESYSFTYIYSRKREKFVMYFLFDCNCKIKSRIILVSSIEFMQCALILTTLMIMLSHFFMPFLFLTFKSIYIILCAFWWNTLISLFDQDWMSSIANQLLPYVLNWEISGEITECILMCDSSIKGVLIPEAVCKSKIAWNFSALFFFFVKPHRHSVLYYKDMNFRFGEIK